MFADTDKPVTRTGRLLFLVYFAYSSSPLTLTKNINLTMNPLVQIYQKEDDPAVEITEKMQASVNSPKRASCSKSASHLLYCYQQADVRMR